MEYANEDFDDSDWFTIEFPGNFNDVFGETVVNDFDGVVWIKHLWGILGMDRKIPLWVHKKPLIMNIYERRRTTILGTFSALFTHFTISF
jgi:hypothetical protein